MLLSIIIPIYNVRRYLKKCIESVIEQNSMNYELILIDDASTDNSLEIAKEYGNKYNVRIIAKERNKGLSDTRNIGIREATGEYILFLDSDDYIESTAVEVIQSVIINQKFPDIIYFGFYEAKDGSDNTVLKYGYKSGKNRKYTGVEFAKSELSKRTLYPAACFGIYKRNFLIENNLFFKVGILHEDELWTPQVVLKAKTIFTSDYAYYHYIKRENSITTKKDKSKNGIDLIEICKELDSLLKRINDQELYRLMNNHIAMVYMKAMSIGKMYEKGKKNYIDRFYPIRKTCFPIDKAKSVLFAISLRMYYLANKIK